MGFFGRLFKLGKPYASGSGSGSSVPNLACEMTIEGKKYLLEEFDVDFSTEDNRRYIPMYAVFSERIAPELESWIMRDSKRCDGVVKFFRNTDKAEDGAVFHLSFYGAVCRRYRKHTRGGVPLTTLVLAARRIRLQEQEFEMR
jgi:hypothetical protein